jgi:archaellum component FlaC
MRNKKNLIDILNLDNEPNIIDKMEELKDLKEQISSLKKENKYLSDKIVSYESDGVSKLYNSLQRKANEMADLLNKHKLTEIDINDSKDKTFERIKSVWTDAKTISESIQILKGFSQKEVEGDTKEVQKKVEERIPITAESVANSVGDLAGQKR